MSASPAYKRYEAEQRKAWKQKELPIRVGSFAAFKRDLKKLREQRRAEKL